MPDPVDPNIPSVDANTPILLNNITSAAEDASKQLTEFTLASDMAKGILNSLDQELSKLNISFNDSQSLTDEQVSKFSILSSTILGVRSSFNQLANVDTRGLNTFSSQIADMTNFILNGQNSISDLVALVKDSFGKDIPEYIQKKGISAVRDYALNVVKSSTRLVESADNANKLQNAIIQLSARTGSLGQVYSVAGENLNNMNAVLMHHQAMINATTEATQLAPAAIENYYAELAAVPGALNAVVAGSQAGNENISMLTATIQLATGTGRNYSEVIDDLKHAFRTYGIQGEEALKFTARMSEISNIYGVEIEDIRDSLRGTAEAFKMFGNEAEGSSRILNNYLGSFQSIGLKGKVATDVISNMTKQIGGLGIAQKAFLSAQTGGPGGLMGAFQIEKMLRDGKIDDVFEKVRQQMQKQFGKIVTIDEAAMSPQAAAQLTKQMTILKQGPLGQFARSDQEAFRILEAFKAKDEGKVTVAPLSDSIVQKNMQTGVDLQRQSNTELSRIRALVESGRGIANIGAQGLLQQGFTANIGKLPAEGDINSQMRTNLRTSMDQSAIRGGRLSNIYNTSLENKNLPNISGMLAADAVRDGRVVYEQISTSLMAPLNTIQQLFNSGQGEKAVDQAKSLMNDIAKRKAEAEKLNEQEKRLQLAKINEDEKIAKRALDFFAKSANNKSATISQESIQKAGEQTTAGAKLAQAPNGIRASKISAPFTTTTPQTDNGMVAQKGSTIKHNIDVNVSGYCIACKQAIEGSAQRYSIFPNRER